jgi:hypothetical protein
MPGKTGKSAHLRVFWAIGHQRFTAESKAVQGSRAIFFRSPSLYRARPYSRSDAIQPGGCCTLQPVGNRRYAQSGAIRPGVCSTKN